MTRRIQSKHCDHCGHSYTSPNLRYCSRLCAQQGQRQTLNTCNTCGKPVKIRYAYCSLTCRAIDKDNRAQDVQWLLDGGESPFQIAARYGIKPQSLARWLDRYGHPELAAPFYRAGWRERPKPNRRRGKRAA